MSLTTPAASSASIAAAIVCRERPTRTANVRPAHSKLASSLTTALASFAYQLVPTLRALVASRVYLAAGDDDVPPGDWAARGGPTP